MFSDGNRFGVLAGIATVLFLLSALVFVRLLPGPLTDGDYLIIGCLSTLISLIVVFVLLVSTGAVGSRSLRDAFFHKRKR
jgi:hypothetical protein